MHIRRAQIRPADHAHDLRVGVGQAQQEVGFIGATARLYRHDRIHARCLLRGQDVARHTVLLQRWHTGADPRKVFRDVVPVVLVGVDLHGRGLEPFFRPA